MKNLQSIFELDINDLPPTVHIYKGLKIMDKNYIDKYRCIQEPDIKTKFDPKTGTTRDVKWLKFFLSLKK